MEQTNEVEQTNFKCPYCERVFKSYCSIVKHALKSHKELNLTYVKVYMDFHNILEVPKCKCGCGGEVTLTKEDGLHFRDYLKGHYGRCHNHFDYSKEKMDLIQEKRREGFKSGRLKQWNKGKSWDETYDKEMQQRMLEKYRTQERCDKISKANSGKPKSEEHKKKIQIDRKKYWSNPQHQDEQRERRVKYLNNYFYTAPSKLEIYFSTLLNDHNIDYIFQYMLCDMNYDYLIKNTNILIEVDGDFWHANPIKYEKVLYDVQKKTVAHDQYKNKKAKENNYILLRFWESEIRNDPEQVMKTICDTINSSKQFIKPIDNDFFNFE